MKVSKFIDGTPDSKICPDRDKGDRLTLKEIQKLVDDDPVLQNLSENQKTGVSCRIEDTSGYDEDWSTRIKSGCGHGL